MDKDFFILRNALYGIGEYPQHQTMGCDENGISYDYKAANSVYQIRSDRFLDITPNFNSIILSRKIKITDKISSSPILWYVMLVSPKLLNLLQLFNLPPHQIYSVPIIHGKKNIAGYSALHILIPEEFIQEVVFEKSKFWVRKGIGIMYEKVEELQINSATDLTEAYNRIQQPSRQLRVQAEYFSLRQDFLEKMDLFAIPGRAFPQAFYVSSKLRDAIEKEGCTGLRFIQRQDWEEGYMSLSGWQSMLNLP